MVGRQGVLLMEADVFSGGDVDAGRTGRLSGRGRRGALGFRAAFLFHLDFAETVAVPDVRVFVEVLAAETVLQVAEKRFHPRMSRGVGCAEFRIEIMKVLGGVNRQAARAAGGGLEI